MDPDNSSEFFQRRNVLTFLLVVLVLCVAAAGIYLIFKKGKFSADTVSTSGASCKHLISYGISNAAYPGYIGGTDPVTHVPYITTIEQNYPYDGQGIQTSVGASSTQGIMKNIDVPYSTIKTELQPLFDMPVKPTKLKHNLFQVLLRNPGVMMTDDAGWNRAAQNFSNFAQALKDLDNSGFPVDGILFDNEGPYSPDTGGYWWCAKGTESAPYNRGCQSDSANANYNLPAWQDKARERGRQLMTALISKFPDIKLVFMHSSNNSCTDVPDDIHNDVYHRNQLLGSFVVGMAEAARGTAAKVIDGGEESYGYTTEAQFTKSYNFRNTDMLTYQNTYVGGTACKFVPDADKADWSTLFGKGFGLYNKPSSGGQSETTIGAATEQALLKSDNYVWFYVEGVTTIGNTPDRNKGGSYSQIAQVWTDAIAAARARVANSSSCDSTEPDPTDKPDLVISKINISPSNPQPGDEVTFSVDVTNQGTVATPTGAGTFLGSAFKIDGSWVTWSDDYTGSLAAGQTMTLTPNYGDSGKKTWTASLGSHTLTAVVDNMAKIAESDEANNTAEQTLNISVKPDLVISKVNITPANPKPGDEVTFTVDVKNQGQAATEVGTGIFLGASFKIDGSWVTWSDDYTGSLAAGQTMTLTPNYGDSGKKTWTASLGSHTLTTVLDNMNKIAETNESNNSSDIAVNVAPSAAVTIQYSPASPTTKTNVTLTAKITGIASAGTIKIYEHGMLRKTCRVTSICTYVRKYSKGTHPYYVTVENPTLRDPLSGEKTFIVN